MSVLAYDPDKFNHNGIVGLVRVSRRITSSPQYGPGWECVYEGDPASVRAAFLQTAATGVHDIYIEEAGPTWRVTVRSSTDPEGVIPDAPSNTFELIGSSSQKDIREHKFALALGHETIDKIDRLLRRSTAVTDAQVSTELSANADAIHLYRLLRQRNGNMAFQVSQYVFRVTTIVSRKSQFAVAYANVNEVYSFSQLITETSPTPDYVVSLTDLQTACQPNDTPTGYTWGWLKQAPTVTNAPGNRTAIQSDFILEEWETAKVYDTA